MENDYPKIVAEVTPSNPVPQEVSNLNPLFEEILQPYLLTKFSSDDS